jgi:hypothetical protein
MDAPIKTLHVLFPSDTLNPREPDEAFLDQVRAFEAAGFPWSLCSVEEMEDGRKGLRGRLEPGRTVLYRGWMLTADQYHLLANAISAGGSSLLTSPESYLVAHHLPNWYPLVRDFTPETRVVPASADLEAELRSLGWEAFFIKDFVKSLKTSVGSVVRDPAQVATVVREMVKFRGEIEGGICVRRFEDFKRETETRYFVIRGRVHASSAQAVIPALVSTCATRIPSPFFSIDVADRVDGKKRIVEIGDGQVSDIVGWTAGRIAEIWKEQCP